MMRLLIHVPVAALASDSGLPSWLTWAQGAWTAGDATVTAAVWLTVACYLWGAILLALLGYLIAADEPDGEVIYFTLIVFVFGPPCWPLIMGTAAIAGAGCAVVIPPRRALQRRRRRQRLRGDARERVRERIAELERELEIG